MTFCATQKDFSLDLKFSTYQPHPPHGKPLKISIFEGAEVGMGFVCFLCASSVVVKSGEERNHLKCPR